MISRKQFLKSASSIFAVTATAPLASLLEACTAVRSVQASVIGNKVVIPVAQLPDFAHPSSYAKVYVDSLPNPFLLFYHETGEFSAVLSTCSHRGCEVNKLRTKFECPCHGSEYDLYGNVLRGPAPEPLKTYRVQKLHDRIEFALKNTP